VDIKLETLELGPARRSKQGKPKPQAKLAGCKALQAGSMKLASWLELPIYKKVCQPRLRKKLKIHNQNYI
jgi:hypothetical protein